MSVVCAQGIHELRRLCCGFEGLLRPILYFQVGVSNSNLQFTFPTFYLIKMWELIELLPVRVTRQLTLYMKHTYVVLLVQASGHELAQMQKGLLQYNNAHPLPVQNPIFS